MGLLLTAVLPVWSTSSGSTPCERSNLLLIRSRRVSAVPLPAGRSGPAGSVARRPAADLVMWLKVYICSVTSQALRGSDEGDFTATGWLFLRYRFCCAQGKHELNSHLDLPQQIKSCLLGFSEAEQILCRKVFNIACVCGHPKTLI